MKTITEFFGPSITTASQKYADFLGAKAEEAKAALIAEGKAEAELTPEELSAKTESLAKEALAAEMKWDGDKVNLLLTVVQLAKSERGRVKRALVHIPQKEGEKPSFKSHEKDGKFFQFEFFPEAGNARVQNSDDRNFNDRGGRGQGRGDKRGGKGGNRGGRNERGQGVERGNDRGGFSREDRPARPRREFSEPRPMNPNSPGIITTSLSDPSKVGPNTRTTERPRREPRAPRPPRRTTAPKFDVSAVDAAIATEPPYLGINRIVPKAKAVGTASSESSNQSMEANSAG